MANHKYYKTVGSLNDPLDNVQEESLDILRSQDLTTILLLWSLVTQPVLGGAHN